MEERKMEKRRITVLEALNELSSLDDRIYKAISKSKFVGACKKSSANVDYISRADFEKSAKSDYDSAVDLILNRNNLKSAIIKSNAITLITVGGKEMTVADAIERKTSIEYDKALLTAMTSQYTNAQRKVEFENTKVDARIDDMFGSYTSKDGNNKITGEELLKLSEPIRNSDEYELVDPFNISDRMTKLDDEIDAFLSEVNTKLQLSNATTYVEI